MDSYTKDIWAEIKPGLVWVNLVDGRHRLFDKTTRSQDLN